MIIFEKWFSFFTRWPSPQDKVFILGAYENNILIFYCETQKNHLKAIFAIIFLGLSYTN
jgi:hypothetical protein